ncbi:bifunctional [glutamate--ammonia ligase]-adenylyl-L-tyrosine phosphorylase/[glutamate--ammonia-ligase] adenylyltransferase [Shewanella sp. OPT22]|nr:bifunctional [glutamate--ammonia ligase]-adenylyl-L-tyrosine phosphorylase/[glutamate--ammonia-ligase] adenylyltransferase [Shewanella sp. OPT22]
MTSEVNANKPLSKDVKQLAAVRLEELSQKAPDVLASMSSEQRYQLEAVLGLSDFVYGQLSRHPQWIPVIVNEVLEDDRCLFYRGILQKKLSEITDIEQAKKTLRNFRNRHMVSIAWRDFLNVGDVRQSLADLSTLAEATILVTRDWLFDLLCKRYGTPVSSNGDTQKLVILGMGKLGGGELNFSSDIDLIFAYPEAGYTRGGRKELDNQQFFTKMGQKLIALLDQCTVDGFVYRVDMRLRPYGDSGPLVFSYSALEHYYQDQGREWERYAMVKGRVLGPHCPERTEIIKLLRPFNYRRYIDYTTIDSLRKMKNMISQEVRRRNLIDNIKLGAGGIREIEFIVQHYQLIHGGRQADLRQQSIYASMESIFHQGLMDYNDVVELRNNYTFLRKLENLLQAIDDKQTQTLPEHELDWQRICWSMQMENEAELRKQLQQVMKSVNEQFKLSIGGEQDEEDHITWAEHLWDEAQSDVGEFVWINQHQKQSEFVSVLYKWRSEVLKRPIGPKGQDKLDKLMPFIIAEVAEHTDPTFVLKPVGKVLEQIVCRTTYLELLYENPGARQQLVRLCAASPWIAEQLAHFPMLLDELIDPVQLYNTTDFEDYTSEAHQYSLRVPEDDMEQQMEAMRQFKLTQQLKIAAADITGVLPITEVSDHLTCLAEAIIAQVVNQAWQQITARHGKPSYLKNNEKGFAVIGYGKLGGKELGYGSDLDLVFLHGNKDDFAQTDGNKPIDCNRFYVKLAQRIIHLFSTRTNSGELYEVDMRLRPSGASGLLVSEIESFGRYQQHAKTWEQQSLVRARKVYGDEGLGQEFIDIRHQILTKVRHLKALVTDVREMRAKMTEHLLTAKVGEFDLKHSSGGIVDIEFLSQYLVLAYANHNPEVTQWTDNINILSSLSDHEMIESKLVNKLVKSYEFFRNLSHKRSLLSLDNKVASTEEIEYYAEFVQQAFTQFLET